MCMNFGAGYYKYHTRNEYCIVEEMEHAAAMGFYLIGRLGHKEYQYHYANQNPFESDGNHDYFYRKFENNGWK